MVRPDVARRRFAWLLVCALAFPAAVHADEPPPVEEGPHKLLNHLECATAVAVADVTHWTTLAAAIFACGRAFLDEPNWLPGGN